MDTQRAQSILSEVVKNTPGLHGVLLLTDDGFPVVSTLQAGETEMRSTAVGAILCDSGERGISELGLGVMDAIVTVGSEGFFIVRRVAAGICLMAVASQDVLLGTALLRIRRALPQLYECLDHRAEVGDPTGPETET
ncbi:MAG: hypothetical protein HZB55_01640 [Deltaproteobacteria bacterium]|nr:hypothetical protein [Deltaproteobacteria bacterium]